MKLKLQTVIACLLVIASFSAKSQTIIPGYNDNDVKKLQTFFAKTDGTTTNGVKNADFYRANDPSRWRGVTWNNDSVKRVIIIDLAYKQLVGSFDCSNFTSLTNIIIEYNNITSLDVTKNTALTHLSCNDNQLTSLDLTQNTALNYLACFNNQLTSLDLPKNTALTDLYCYNNNLTSLDLTKNTALTNLSCNNNQLTALDVTKNTALTALECHVNKLTNLDVTKNTALNFLYCYNNNLTSLDITKNTDLWSLLCSNNKLTSLDITKNTALNDLSCNNNQLTALDVTKNTGLWTLYCDSNQLTDLDVTKNTGLVNLHCSKNQLTDLDISKNMGLSDLYCDGNKLTSLNLATPLSFKFRCANNQLKFSDMKYSSYAYDLSLSPQRPFIPLGVTTHYNNMMAAFGGRIDLCREANVSPNGTPAATTFHVWKKAADATITDVTTECIINNGLITLPDTAEAGDSLFITMSNPTYPTCSEQTTDPLSSSMRTCTFALVDSLIPLDSLIPPIKIYPNPANNQVYISGNEDQLNSVRIYNSFGQDVTKFTNYSISNVGQIQIDISKLDNGIYILKTKNTTNRLIVE